MPLTRETQPNNNNNSNSNLPTVEKDTVAITESVSETEVFDLRHTGVIMDDFTRVEALSTFKDFVRIDKDEIILLGAPSSPFSGLIGVDSSRFLLA